MVKGTYYVSMKKGRTVELQEIPGYLYEVNGIQYGVSDRINRNGLVSKAGYWTVTELSTGYAVGYSAHTRKAAMNEAARFYDQVPRILENSKDYIEKLWKKATVVKIKE